VERIMDLSVDLRVAELLASRLCHDLVGPIGAVSNGMELMADEGLGMADEALALAGNSAAQASDLLQYYRLAYGFAGGRQGSDLTPLRALAEDFVGHHKTSLDWGSSGAADLPEGAGKLILNLIAFAVEALPRGGTVGVSLADHAGGLQVQVQAVGGGAALRPEAREALAEGVTVEQLTPRNVHGYFTRLVARRLGGELAVEEAGDGLVRFSAVLPA